MLSKITSASKKDKKKDWVSRRNRSICYNIRDKTKASQGSGAGARGGAPPQTPPSNRVSGGRLGTPNRSFVIHIRDRVNSRVTRLITFHTTTCCSTFSSLRSDSSNCASALLHSLSKKAIRAMELPFPLAFRRLILSLHRFPLDLPSISVNLPHHSPRDRGAKGCTCSTSLTRVLYPGPRGMEVPLVPPIYYRGPLQPKEFSRNKY